MNRMRLKLWLSLAIVMGIALGAGSAWAQAPAQGQALALVGPVNPANGFPLLYQDKAGVALEQCLVPTTGDPAVVGGDPCGLTGTLPGLDGTTPLFPSNFPEEFFYSRAVAVMDLTVIDPSTNQPGKATLVHALEGAFLNGGVAAGDQMVFARLRVKVTGGLTIGQTYTVTHPYGVNTYVATDNGLGSGEIKNITVDQGCFAAPCDFTIARDSSNIGPFLRWDPTGPAGALPAGYLGDPAVATTILGSPFNTNVFQIRNGTGTLIGSTTLFTIWGKLFTGVFPSALTVDRTSYVRNASGVKINVFARSVTTATVSATGSGIPNTTLARDPATGRFFAQISLAANAAIPAFITITATDGANTPTTIDSALIDDVLIDAATYDVGTGALTVQAHSSDVLGAPQLTVLSKEVPPQTLGTLASGGVFTLSTVAPPAGVTVRSAFGGSESRVVDASPGGTGGQIATTTSLVSNLNPSELGQPVTFTATIVAAGSPTGTITFKDGATAIGSGTVVNKTASFTAPSLAIGSHTFTATYSGDAAFAGSTSNAVIQVVNKATTTLTLFGNPNPSPLGQAVTFSSSVTAAPAAGIPTGTVTFFDGGTALGTSQVVNGLASISVSTLTVGSHLITSSYSGDARFKASASPIFTQTVQTGLSGTTLTVAPNPAARKQLVTLTATVNLTTLSAGGTVTFRNGTTVIGNAVVGATGVATLTWPAPNQRGTFNLTAAYGGNANLAPSTSGTVSLVVQ